MEIISISPGLNGMALIRKIGIEANRPVVAFMGGAMRIDQQGLTRQISAGLAKAIVEIDAIVVDGGSNHGTMALLNAGLGERGFKGTYIGVAPAPLVCIEEKETNKGLTQVGDNHSHLVLTEGEQWGDERETMYKIINSLAAENPSISVLANGGPLALNEVIENVKVEREVIVLVGSGRLADQVAKQINRPKIFQKRTYKNLSQQGRFTLFDIEQPPEKFAALVKEKLQQ